MTFITDRISIGSGQTITTSNVLDVSGNVAISSLRGVGNRLLIVGHDGSLGSQAMPSTVPFNAFNNVMGLFGNGSMGNVTINSVINLERDVFYRNLTINNGGRINTNGNVVRVFETLTINSGGIIACNGGNGSNAIAGTGGLGGFVPYSFVSSRFPFQGIPSPGATGQSSISASTANNFGSLGGSSIVSMHHTAPPIIRSGTGGGGGGCHGNGGVLTAGETNLFAAGIGGQGGRSSGVGIVSLGGGGGGAGGGVLIIYANTINNMGSIEANGGNGGNGAVSGANSAGGGGGGGGGVVLIFYRTLMGNGLGSHVANGGLQGTGGIASGHYATPGIVLSYRM